MFTYAFEAVMAQDHDQLLVDAEHALHQGRYDDVELLLQSVTDSQANLLRGRADIERGRYVRAEEWLSAAVTVTPGGDAALQLGLLQAYLGRREEAIRTLTFVLDQTIDLTNVNDLSRAGLAARALGQFEHANSLFRDANTLAPSNVTNNTAWGELFFEKFNREEAGKSFSAALATDVSWVPAHVGLARTMTESNPPVARDIVTKALAINPYSVPALLVLAELELNDDKQVEASTIIQRALTVNPNSLEALSLQASIHYVQGRITRFNKITEDILTINPLFGDVYRITAKHAARNYRFDEAVVLTRRALAIDSTIPQAWSELGMHLLRIGDEADARNALERAFEIDPYNVITFNLLSMLDTLDKFKTIVHGNIVMRVHQDELVVMREHVLPLAREALDFLMRQYDFIPEDSIIIEIFPKHDDFSVRTLGLPGMIGALGACFGRVVTMDSPSARPTGTFNWGATLWHELAHVISLQMSNQRVPRWLSEGISVFEEKRARQRWDRDMELVFAQALDQGALLSLEDLDSGFSDPKTISLAYYESSLFVEHIIQLVGEKKLHDLLRAYGRGLDTEKAFEKSLGLTLKQLQKSFDDFLEDRFGQLRLILRPPSLPMQGLTIVQLRALLEADQDSYPLHMMLAEALEQQGDAEGAIMLLERAAELVPTATGPKSPYATIAKIALTQEDSERAIKALEALLAIDHTDIVSARQLTSLVTPLANPTQAVAAYQQVIEIDPFDGQAQSGLGRNALKLGDIPTAVRSFRSALAVSPVDPATAHTDLAEAYLFGLKLKEARDEILMALEIAPSFERAQELLLTLLEEEEP